MRRTFPLHNKAIAALPASPRPELQLAISLTETSALCTFAAHETSSARQCQHASDSHRPLHRTLRVPGVRALQLAAVASMLSVSFACAQTPDTVRIGYQKSSTLDRRAEDQWRIGEGARAARREDSWHEFPERPAAARGHQHQQCRFRSRCRRLPCRCSRNAYAKLSNT